MFCNGNSIAGVDANKRMLRHGEVEGHVVEDILLDTRCTKTVVQSDLVDILRGRTITIQCAHGDMVAYHFASWRSR